MRGFERQASPFSIFSANAGGGDFFAPHNEGAKIPAALLPQNVTVTQSS
jgi:hypothetical protein